MLDLCTNKTLQKKSYSISASKGKEKYNTGRGEDFIHLCRYFIEFNHQPSSSITSELRFCLRYFAGFEQVLTDLS